MKNTKLYRILKSLSSRDCSKLEKFLASPYHNRRSDILSLYQYLVERIKTGKPLPIREVIHRELFPETAFEKKNFFLLLSYLYKKVEAFFIQEELKVEDLLRDLLLVRALRKRRLSHDFEQCYGKISRSFDNQPLRNAAYYDRYYQLCWEGYQHFSMHEPADPAGLEAMTNSIEIGYLTKKLKHLCLVSAQQSVYNTSTGGNENVDTLKALNCEDRLDIPAISIYFFGYKMQFELENERHFRSFKEQVLEHGAKFSASEIRDLYTLAINYCIRKANTGKENFLRELMDLYKEGLERQYLLENGMISRFAYHNITAAGLRTGQFDWVESFIYRYKISLEKTYRESSFSFNLARLEYARKNYEAALELLQKFDYNDLLLNLAAKTVLLKIYYEMEELKLLESHLEAMKNFIRRKKILGYHRSNYLNIIYYTRKLTEVNIFERDSVKKLLDRIEKEEVLTEKEWLLEQLK